MTDTCVKEGCERPVFNKKRGLCSMHYQRERDRLMASGEWESRADKRREVESRPKAYAPVAPRQKQRRRSDTIRNLQARINTYEDNYVEVLERVQHQHGELDEQQLIGFRLCYVELVGPVPTLDEGEDGNGTQVHSD